MRFRDEEHFTRVVIELAHMAQWLVHHDRGEMKQHIQGDVGFPDLVLAKNGHVIIVELKTTLGRLTPKQHAWQKQLGAWSLSMNTHTTNGLQVGVWRPEDWDDIVETLTGRRPGGVL